MESGPASAAHRAVGSLPIVAIGDVTNVAPFGIQRLDHSPPRSASPNLRRLFWCQGDFHSISVIKGDLPLHKKYVWGSASPGCKLHADPGIYKKPVTHVWFLRDENEFLRPTFDAGGGRSYGLLTDWANGPSLPAKEKLGALLLTPSANSESLHDYVNVFPDAEALAWLLLGKPECVGRIKILAGLGDMELREDGMWNITVRL
jgi:hypothetical protein